MSRFLANLHIYVIRQSFIYINKCRFWEMVPVSLQNSPQKNISSQLVKIGGNIYTSIHLVLKSEQGIKQAHNGTRDTLVLQLQFAGFSGEREHTAVAAQRGTKSLLLKWSKLPGVKGRLVWGEKKKSGKGKGRKTGELEKGGETRATVRKWRRGKKDEGASVMCTGLSGTVWLQVLFIICLHKYLDSWTFFRMYTWLMFFISKLCLKVFCEPECCTWTTVLIFCSCQNLSCLSIRAMLHINTVLWWVEMGTLFVCLLSMSLLVIHLWWRFGWCSPAIILASLFSFSLCLVQANLKQICWAGVAYITGVDGEEAGRSLSHEASARASPRTPWDPAATWPSWSSPDLISSESGTFSEQGWAKACYK